MELLNTAFEPCTAVFIAPSLTAAVRPASTAAKSALDEAVCVVRVSTTMSYETWLKRSVREGQGRSWLRGSLHCKGLGEGETHRNGCDRETPAVRSRVGLRFIRVAEAAPCSCLHNNNVPDVGSRDARDGARYSGRERCLAGLGLRVGQLDVPEGQRCRDRDYRLRAGLRWVTGRWGWRSEVGGRRSEVGGWRSEVVRHKLGAWEVERLGPTRVYAG